MEHPPYRRVINTAQEALEYLVESWDVPQELRQVVEHEIEVVLHKHIGEPRPVDVRRLRQVMKQMEPVDIGEQLRDYVAEAEHGSFDGWESDEERAVIERFLEDLAIWFEEYGPTEDQPLDPSVKYPPPEQVDTQDWE